MTVSEAIKASTGELSIAGINSAKLDAELLLALVLKQSREYVLAHGDQKLSPDRLNQLDHLISRRADRTPLVHLTGVREFYGLDLEITPDVLTPRAETEQMIEWAIKYAPQDSKLIDVGTGSGAIAIALAKHRPDLEISATDVTPEALQVARQNAAKHKLNINFVQSDLFDAVTETFATVVTNLPYLKDDADLMPEVSREPGVALFGGPDGLDLYRRLLKQLPKHLAPSGHLFTECDPWQQDNLIAEAAKFGLSPIERGYFITGFKRS